MKFRKRPVVIEARRLTATNLFEIREWTGGESLVDDTWATPRLLIRTLEGDMSAQIGDWIIRGVQGEFYPCRSDIFAETYEPVEDGAK